MESERGASVKSSAEMEIGMKKGKLYGIGVGPGDPELMTLKAVRLIRECPAIAVPGKKKEDTLAYRIALGAVPELSEKLCLEIDMPMIKEKEKLRESHRLGAEKIAAVLAEGKDVAFLTLGDTTIYSTFGYMEKLISIAGYETEFISGVPSFCAAAARLGISLGEREEQIHIIPANYEMEAAAGLPGTKVFMKSGKKLGKLKELIKDQSREEKKKLQKLPELYMAENCTMETEKLYRGIEEMPESGSYYSLVIMKE